MCQNTRDSGLRGFFAPFAVKKQVQGAPDPPDGEHLFRQGNAKNTVFPDKTPTRASGSAGAAVHQRQ